MEEIQKTDIRPEFYSKENKKCYTCIFKNTVPGSTHSSCSKKNAIINADNHGIKNGWANWPWDFDPIWINSCDSYYNKEKTLFLDNTEDLKRQLMIQIFYQRKKIDFILEDLQISFQKMQENNLKILIDNYRNALENNPVKDFMKIDSYSQEELEELNKLLNRLLQI